MSSDLYDLPFRASDYEPSEGPVPVPMGDYPVIVTDADISRTHSGNGHQFKVTYQITEGEFANRKLWSRHNIDNPSTEAQNIARSEVSALAHAIGRPDAECLQDYLHGRCLVTVVIRQDPGYEPQNHIKRWKTVDGQIPKRRSPFRGQRTAETGDRPVPGTTEAQTDAGVESRAPAPARVWENPQGEAVTARTESQQPSAGTATDRPDGEKLTGSETTPKEDSQKTSTQTDEQQRQERIQAATRDSFAIEAPTDEERRTLQMAIDSLQGCRTLEQLEQCGQDLQDMLHPELKGEAVRVYRMVRQQFSNP